MRWLPLRRAPACAGARAGGIFGENDKRIAADLPVRAQGGIDGWKERVDLTASLGL